MTAHADRAHAVLSASSAHRWLLCPPSALLEQQFPDTTSTYASEGTLAHEICEIKLQRYIGSISKATGTRRLNKLRQNEQYTTEMERYTDDYLDFIKAAALKFKDMPYVAIEKRVDFSAWVPDGFGTADCILIGDDSMHIVDFKYGKNVLVSPVDNPQMQLYALGAYSMYGLLYNIESIQMSIFQPRMDNIETWETSLDTVLAFGEWARPIAEKAIKGEGSYNPGKSQCRFCRAVNCEARAKENIKLSKETDKKPELLSNGEIGEYLLKGEDVARWLADLKEYALKESLAGREVAGWKAVEGRGSRTWTDGDAAFRKLIASGIDEAMLYERKPLTLAQTEKMVGKKKFTELVGEFIEKKPGKPALVQLSDKRPAITNAVTAAEAFGQ